MYSVGPARLRPSSHLTPAPRLLRPSLAHLAPPAPAHAHDPLCSPTRWAQVLVSGFTGSYLQGSCQWSRLRAPGPKATLNNHPSPTPTYLSEHNLLGFTRLHSASLGFTRLRSASLGFAWLRSASLGLLGFARLARLAQLHSASLSFTRLHSAPLGSTPLHSASLLQRSKRTPSNPQVETNTLQSRANPGPIPGALRAAGIGVCSTLHLM